ncbi:MAG: dihydrolipoyl dehydrogenase [Planctomycetota bacterium]
MVMGDQRMQADVVVIGAGPGGYVAACHAADLGLSVTLVEARPQLGGVCLIEGCIPSKALINAVEVAEHAKAGAAMGVIADNVRFDLDKLRDFRGKLVDGITKGVDYLCKSREIEIVQGKARFTGPGQIKLEGSEYSGIDFQHCIIAVGSRPFLLPFMRDKGVWTSTEALLVPRLPGKLLVIGGGYIGLELGIVYAGLGSEVHLVEMLPRILATADEDLVEPVHRHIKKKFKTLRFGAKVTAVEKDGDGYQVTIEDKDGKATTEPYDNVFAAIGRTPNTDDLGLETLGIKLIESGIDRGKIQVDSQMRTSAANVYAIGDIVPGFPLAHKASREGKVAAEVISGKPSAFDNRTVPAVVFTHPEVAWAGLTEIECKEQGIDYIVGSFPLTALGRAKAINETAGKAKVIAEKESGLVLGVGYTGAHASDIIGEGALALEMGATIEDLSVTIHPHPTMGEAVMQAAEVAGGHCADLPRPRKKA